jgi:hypothetical protein
MLVRVINSDVSECLSSRVRECGKEGHENGVNEENHDRNAQRATAGCGYSSDDGR